MMSNAATMARRIVAVEPCVIGQAGGEPITSIAAVTGNVRSLGCLRVMRLQAIGNDVAPTLKKRGTICRRTGLRLTSELSEVTLKSPCITADHRFVHYHAGAVPLRIVSFSVTALSADCCEMRRLL